MSLGAMGKHKISVDTTTIANGDSLAAYLTDSAGALLTSSLISGKQRLDVVSTAEYAEDVLHVSGDRGMFVLAVRNDADATLTSADGDYSPIAVDNKGRVKVLADFDVDFDFVYAEDSGHVSGDLGSFMLAVRNDSNAVLTSADLDYSPVAVDSAGRIKISQQATYNEDSASISGDLGSFSLAVRRDTVGAQTSADGDYSEFQTNARGELRVINKIEGSTLQQKVTVTTTAAAVPASALTDRKHLMIQNISNQDIYLGSSTVTSSGATQGLIVPKGGFWEADVSSSVSIFAITATGTADVIIWEFK